MKKVKVRWVFVLVACYGLTGCAAGISGNPGGSITTEQGVTLQPSNPSLHPSEDKRNERIVDVVAFEHNGVKIAADGWAQVALPEPPLGGEIRAVGVCSSPACRVAMVQGKEWTLSRAVVGAAEGCIEEAAALKDSVLDLFDGSIHVERSQEMIIITNDGYRLTLAGQKQK